jgi:protein pelota
MRYKFDLKHGIAKLKPENMEDIILLYSLLSPGCIVKAETLRSKEIIRDGKKVKVGKEKVKLAIEVEKIELKDGSLRLLGKIVEAKEGVGKFHSIEVAPQTEIIVKKEWKNWEVERVRKFSVRTENVLVCILDEKDCDLYIVGDRIKHVAHFHVRGSKDFEQTEKIKWFSEIFYTMKSNETNHVIICGPGFAKEDFFAWIREKDKEFVRKILLDSVAHTGIAGLNELLKRKTLEKVAKFSRISQETAIVENFFEELAKDGKVVYGKEDTLRALELGALETLLISIKLLKEFIDLMEKADAMKTRVVVISDSHPAGEKFLRFCGIGGFLRYKIE